MKLYLLFLTLLIPQLEMNEYQYELLLGKDISNIKIDNSEFNIDKGDYYSIPFIDSPKTYYNNYIYFMSFCTNDKKKITEVSIKLKLLVNEELYNTLTKIYGKPTMILVPNKILYDKTIESEKVKATVRKTKKKAKQGTFKDNPTFLIWKKKDYRLEILMKYEQNISEISFKMNE